MKVVARGEMTVPIALGRGAYPYIWRSPLEGRRDTLNADSLEGIREQNSQDRDWVVGVEWHRTVTPSQTGGLMNMVRHCARCDTDYRVEILTCAECGEEMELRAEAGEAEPATSAEPPPGDYRSLYYSDRIEDLEPLAEELTRRSIPFRIDFSGDAKITLVPHSRFDLLVREEERERARETLSSLPQASDLELTDEAAEKGFDPKRGYSRCPGCSADLPAGALKCPDCGLALGGSLEPLLCSACGWEVSPADLACPRCGAVLED